jgi:hypothetical protein
MGIALGGVEEQVTHPGARDVLQLGRDVRKDDAAGDALAAPVARGAAEVRLAELGEAQEPEVGFGRGCEDAQPGAEGCRVDLGWC